MTTIAEPPTLHLRDYQQACLDAIADAYKRNPSGHPAVVLPTGGGKTVIFSHLASQMTGNAEARMLVLAHREELITQAANKIRAVDPTLDVGIVKAARNDANAQVVVASVQTLASAVRRAAIGHVDVIVIDEAHHAAAKTYRTVLETWPEAFVVGFSATLKRTDGKALGEIFDEIVYTRELLTMIEEGYLVEPRGITVTVRDLDLSKVKTSHGDYQDGQLGAAMSAALAPKLAAKAYVEHARDRSGILFAPTVDSAYEFAEAMLSAGIMTETVHGAMPTEQRVAVLNRLETGQTQVVTNCMVLTEGFDCPRVSAAVIARPTQSGPLYTQMVGRVLRLFPGKEDALVLDIAGVTRGQKLITLATLMGAESKKKTPADEITETAEPMPGEGQEILYADGEEIIAAEVDLFGRSATAWQRTYKGIWFMPTDAGYAFLYRSRNDPGLWNTYLAHKTGRKIDRLAADLPLPQAKRFAEVKLGSALSGKRWRKEDTPATAAQIQLIFTNRLAQGGEYLTKGEAARRLDLHFASARLDALRPR